jgi:type 1 fimbriae regulatory protein FimB
MRQKTTLNKKTTSRKSVKRGRKHLSAVEVGKLIDAAEQGRNAARDKCFLLLMFRHGFRVSELCNLKRHQIDMESRIIHVERLKKGLSTTHPLRTDELRALKSYIRIQSNKHPHGYFFLSERGQPLSRITAWLLIRTLGERADLPLPVHPHMLRHACGYALADQGADTRLIQDYLGHRNIQHTVRYTATNPARFEKLWNL